MSEFQSIDNLIPTKHDIALEQIRKAGRWLQAPLINTLLSYAANDLPSIRELARCGKPALDGLGKKHKTRNWNGISFNAPRHKCNLPYCVRCAARLRQKEAKRIWRNLTAIVTPNRTYISWLTIRGEIHPLGSDFSAAKDRMKRKLHKIFRRNFPTCQVSAQFSISPRQDGTGLLHIHGLIAHKNISRRDLENILKKEFEGRNAVLIQEPNSDNIDKEWIEPGDAKRASGFGRYSCDVRLEGTRWYGKELPELLLKQINSWDSIRGHGRRGLRLEIGFRRNRKQSGTSNLGIIKRLQKKHRIGGTFHRNSCEHSQAPN